MRRMTWAHGPWTMADGMADGSAQRIACRQSHGLPCATGHSRLLTTWAKRRLPRRNPDVTNVAHLLASAHPSARPSLPPNQPPPPSRGGAAGTSSTLRFTTLRAATVTAGRRSTRNTSPPASCFPLCSLDACCPRHTRVAVPLSTLLAGNCLISYH